MATKENVLHADMPVFGIDERRKNTILTLCNFRAYGSCEIKVPNDSVTLINGPSGVGKTTILEAVVFVLYNAVPSPERFKTKKCWVYLFCGDYVIYRQKDPQLLKLWKIPLDATSTRQTEEYTQEEAQQKINSIYGTAEVFLSCSYLRQKEFSVFLGTSDAEKLAIVKAVALKGAELDEIKIPIKQKCAELESQYTAAKAQLDLSVRNVQGFDQRHPQIVQSQVPENPADVLQKVQELRGQQENLDRDFEQSVQRESAMNLIKQQLDGIRTRKMQAEAQLPKISVDQLKNRLDEIEARLKELSGVAVDHERMAKAQIFKIWQQEDQRLEAAVKTAEADLANIGATIKKTFADFPQGTPEALSYLEKKRVRLEELQAKNQEIRVMLGQAGIVSVADGKTQLTNLEADLTKAKDKESAIRADLDKARLANRMKCPQCQTTVIVAEDGKHLEKCTDVPPPPTGIGAAIGHQTPENKKSPTAGPTVTHDDLAKAASETASISSRRDRLQGALAELELKNKDLDPTELNTSLPLLPSFTKYVEIHKTRDLALESKARSLNVKPEEVAPEKTVDTSAKSGLESERTQIKNQLDNYHRLSQIVAAEDGNLQQFTTLMTNYINQPGQSSVDIRKNRMSIQASIDQLLHLNTASELLAQRGILDKTMREKAETAQKIERQYQASIRLLAKTTEAERISLQTAIDEINSALSKILKRLFTAVPISVEISATKKLKSKKDAVSQRFDLKIFYNNAEYKSANQLSGGEKDRLSLAITLAMSQKFGSPFLFLDETLASLNPELKSDVVGLLKEFAPGRTVIVISHDETEGFFDNVIRIRGND